MPFLLNCLTIAFVNLLLSGDNGILIALVLRSLPSRLRRRFTVTAAGCAVIARTMTTFLAAQLLTIAFLKCVGGILILSMSLGLFREALSEEPRVRTFSGSWTAIGFVVVADLLLSIDNTVAIAGLAQGRAYLLFSGLAISIPLVFFGSEFLCAAMARAPAAIYLGAGILGMLAGRMILTDAAIVRRFHPDLFAQRCGEAIAAVAVLTVGLWLRTRCHSVHIDHQGSRPLRTLGVEGHSHGIATHKQ